MAKIILVTGGSRSGKSSYALKRAESLPGPRTFIATSPRLDAEMSARIDRHRKERDPRRWKTLEEQMNLDGALKRCRRTSVVLVDCLSLWLNNLLYDAQQKRRVLDEDMIVRWTKTLLATLRRHNGTVFFVTNEIGLGLVPDNAVSRLYRDMLGRCNQTVAAAADEVVFMVSGIPMILKEKEPL